MKTPLKTTVVAILLSCSSAFSASITVKNFDDFPSTNVVTNDAGVRLSDTSFVGIGYFNTLSDAFLQTLTPTTFSSILAGGEFNQFGGNIPWFPGGGVYQGDATGAILAGSSFIGKNIYTVIGNGASLAASTELLIVKHTGTFGQDNPVFSGTATLDAAGGTGNGTVLWGNLGKTSTDINALFGAGGTEPNYSTLGASTSIVPEPSRAILAGLGLMGFMFRRRRA